jgi:hypothetical protein
MNIPLVLSRLADALLRWADSFATDTYQARRLAEFWALVQGKRLRWNYIHIRVLTDRIVPLGDGLEGWLLDLWCLSPLSTPALSHGLQVFVYPEGLQQVPVPSYEGPFALGLVRYYEGTSTIRWVIEDTPVQPSPSPYYQCFVPGSVSGYRGRRWKNAWPWEQRSSVRLRPGMSRNDLLAQLLLLALRQGVGDEEIHRRLVEYGRKGMPTRARPLVPAAVDHAVLHFLLPVASLRWYIGKVARGMAQEGKPPRLVREEAARLDASVRTVYRWRRGYRAEELPALADNLKRKRRKVALARYVAQRQGISYDAARMRVRRRLAGGESLEQVARDIISGS